MSFAHTLDPEVGQRIRHRRVALGLTEHELGVRAECRQQTIHGIEVGKHGMSIALAGRIAKALEVSVGELLASNEAAV